MASFIAPIDFSRPTNSGMIMCGKTITSRSGRRGSLSGTGAASVSGIFGPFRVLALSVMAVNLTAGPDFCKRPVCRSPQDSSETTACLSSSRSDDLTT